MSEAGVCSALSDYARSCAKAGITIDWVENHAQCQSKCPGETVFKQCGPSCGQTCASINEKSCVDDKCVEGCSCQPGFFLGT